MPERLQGGTADSWKTYENQHYPDGVVLDGVSYVLIERCDISNPGGVGVRIVGESHHITIRDNGIHDCGISADTLFSGIHVDPVKERDYWCDVLIEDNVIYDCIGAGIAIDGRSDREVGGVPAPLYVAGVTVRSNDVSHITPADGEQQWQATGFGIIATTARDILAENNLVHHTALSALHADCRTRLPLPPIGQCERITFRGNMTWETGDTAIQFEGAVDSMAEENDVMGLADGAAAYRGAFVDTCYAARNTWRRNIVDGTGYTGPIYVCEEGASAVTFDHNTIVAGGKSVSLEEAGASVGSRFTSNIWRGMSAWGSGHVQVGNFKLPADLAEVFVDPANHDYGLKPGSPAIGAGEDGTDAGAIPFEEETGMAVTLTETITPEPVTNVAYLDLVSAGVNQAQVVRKDAAGNVIETLDTYTLQNNVVVEQNS